MDTVSLTELAAQHLEIARAAESKRSAITVYGGRERHLRQTLLAIVAGHGLDEHRSPGEATLQVITGRIVLRSATRSWELEPGSYVEIPDEVHAVDVIEDAAFLLSVVKRESHTR